MSAPAFRRALPRLAAVAPTASSTLIPCRFASFQAPGSASNASAMGNLLNILDQHAPRSAARVTPITAEPLFGQLGSELDAEVSTASFFQTLTQAPVEENYHLHVYATKHNTHITFTRPDKRPIISLSAGNVGFKKAHRSTYDAAYQLAAHVFQKIQDQKIAPRSVEVVLRGFGQGREAVIKALLGQEGRYLKPVVTRVTDSTRLKFGGTRSKRPRRLG